EAYAAAHVEVVRRYDADGDSIADGGVAGTREANAAVRGEDDRHDVRACHRSSLLAQLGGPPGLGRSTALFTRHWAAPRGGRRRRAELSRHPYVLARRVPKLDDDGALGDKRWCERSPLLLGRRP